MRGFGSLITLFKRVADSDWIVASGVGLAALTVYVYTLAPTVSVEDTGELIAAAYTLGIPHPTGYPLWVILAHLFQLAVPVGEVAWRVNLFSAVCGAVTCLLVTHLGIRMHGGKLGAAAGGLALAFSREFWEQSVVAEVYTLNTLLLVACLVLLHRWHKQQDTRWLSLFGLVYGLSLGVHSTMFLLGPLFAVFVVAVRGFGRRAFFGYMSALCLAGLGAMVYLYLPIRSSMDPPMDWGNPENWRNFLSVFTREQYQSIFTEYPRSVSHFALQTRAFLGVAAWEFTPWIGALALAGSVLAFRRELSWNVLLVSMAILLFLTTILIPNFPIEASYVWINTPYWIPVYVVSALWIGRGAVWVEQFGGDRSWLVATLIVAALSPLVANFNHCNKRDYYFSYVYGQNLFAAMAQDAIYFGGGDHTIFPLLYLKHVEGRRQDLTMANPYGYVSAEMYEGMPEEQREGFGKYPTFDDEPAIMEWVLRHTDRPVYSAVKRRVRGATVVDVPFLYRYLRPGEENTSSGPTRLLTGYDAYWQDPRGDWTAKLILFEYYTSLARAMKSEERVEDRLWNMEKAEKISEDNKENLNNLGALYAEFGYPDKAEACFRKALALRPDYETARRNLKRLEGRADRPTP
ncbi:MAG: hypothetical protein AMXMBFR84_01950 [Candidatus Hydrogenedentota bacterium]